MLSRLHIENYALIDTLDIELPSRLTIITGETGAGKSIILGALGLLMGARTDVKQLRDPDRRIVVEAEFKDVDKDFLQRIILSYPVEEAVTKKLAVAVGAADTLLLRREVSPAGRTKAYVNNYGVTLRRLSLIALQLIDIHSQRSNSLLERYDFQLAVLDTIAGDPSLLDAYRRSFDRYASLRRRLKQQREDLERNRREQELNAFRLERLRELKPRAGEQHELEHRIEILSDAEKIRGTLGYVCRLLDGDDSAALSSLHEACGELSRVSPSVFESAGESPGDSLLNRLRSAEIEVRDIVDTLHERFGDVESDPALLQKSEARLEAIYAEEKRFGVDSDAELERIKHELETSVAALAQGDDAVKELEHEVRKAAMDLREAAASLSIARQSAADKFSESLLKLARPLGMSNLNFKVEMVPLPRLSPDGADKPEFLCAFNKNQQLRRFSEIASGGERSRLMLCVKAIVAGKMQMPTVIFDEIDTGVSGDIADRMGRMMCAMAESMQVIAITHLPQVAVMGDVHFKVYKEDDAESTFTRMSRLDDASREREVARMLSGSVIDEAALLNARSLLSRDSEKDASKDGVLPLDS